MIIGIPCFELPAERLVFGFLSHNSALSVVRHALSFRT
jgi:hypothetical protein